MLAPEPLDPDIDDHDLVVGGAVTLPAEDDPTPAPGTPSGARWWLYVVGLGAGALGTVLGFDGLGGAIAMELRVALVLVGLWLVLVGLRAVLSRLRGRPVDLGFWLSAGWMALLIGAAGLADILPLGEASDVSKTLTAPSLQGPALFSAHPLGTDRQGLDILAELIYGARVSLIVGLAAVAVGTIVGGLIGLVAGYYRGWCERVVSVVSDSMLAFPPLVLLLAMVAVLQPSVRNVSIALAILIIPTYIRLVKANVLTFSQREFVLSAQALGAGDRRIIFREILPNVALPVISYGFLIVAVLIVAEASLSFLGLSIQRPNPTWGNLIAAGQNDFERYPALVFVPGIVLFITVFALNRIGDRLRSWWEPKGSHG